MKSLILLLSLLPASAFALTQTLQTLTPKAGQNELKGGISYSHVSAEADLGGSATSNQFVIPVSYFYGITTHHAVGVETYYLKNDSNFSKAGLSGSGETQDFGNIDISYKGNLDTESGTVYLEAGVSFPSEKYEFNSNDAKFSASTGQTTVTLAAGYVQKLVDFTLGAIAAYDIAMEGDADVDVGAFSDSGKVKGGSQVRFSFFGELEGESHPNFSLTYARTYSRSFSSDSVTGTIDDDLEMFYANFSARMPVAERLEFIPTAGLATVMNQSDRGLEKYNMFTAAAQLRYLF
ncbi:hypothetical protein ACES2I_17110 [Bdellovibrio bacteriovorus]|uniref:hypothetical protein n=1 Tax=Bdellovibrio bacteriovorus TaxID=959 RepID=UPI0035A73EB1